MHIAYPKNRLTLVCGLSLGCLALLPGIAPGQGAKSGYSSGGGYSGYSSIRQREAIRRQNLVAEAEQLLMEGREAYAKGDYELAVQKYRQALNTLPKGLATQDREQAIIQHLSDGSVALAQQYRRVGKYDEAQELLDGVLIADPENAAAQKQIDWLNDPIRTNPSLTYEHTQDIDKVRRHLYKGEGFYNLGKFPEAHREFDAVLRIDPHNKAARRWQEKVNAARTDYYRAAYDEARSRLLMEVDRAWEMAVPPEPGTTDTSFSNANTDLGGAFEIKNKLNAIIIPSVDFERITVEEAIDFLRQRSRELDNTTTDPANKGINFVIRKGRLDAGGTIDTELDGEGGLGAGSDPSGEMIQELKLSNVPLLTVLQYICDQAKLRYKVDDFAVTLLPLGSGEGEDLLTRTWTVPPTFIDDITVGGDGAGGDDLDPFADDGGLGGGGRITARPPLRELLENNGISFPEGSSASYLPGPSTLVVRNTPANLDLVDALVNQVIGKTPKMINIQTKFVEINQENTEELGFDWIISPFSLGSIPSNGEAFVGGGTIGNGSTRTGADFISPVAQTTIPGVPASPDQPVSNIVTGGLRSGDNAITRNSIDAILNNPTRSSQNNNVAPGVISVTGIFNDRAFQMIMRGLDQKKGADIMTAPSVVARPGQKATIEIIREFIYPTEYEPPELPNSIGGNGNFGGGGIVGGGGVGAFPVTPATPTAFDMRPTGVTLEVEPNVGNNDYVIELRLAPEIVEFEGFINYGSPITSPTQDVFGNPTSVTITENRIEMPVFSTRRVTTGITIYDGHTVAIGGLMREDIQKVEDKVPIFGDIPLIGRLFQSESENQIKSNLIVFVTAQIIDATGQPLRGGGNVGVTGGLPDPGAEPLDTLLPPNL